MGLDIYMLDYYGVTIFLWACYKGHKNVEILLLKHTYKIEVNAKNNDGNTAAIIAMRAEEDSKIFCALFQNHFFLFGNKLQYLIFIHLTHLQYNFFAKIKGHNQKI